MSGLRQLWNEEFRVGRIATILWVWDDPRRTRGSGLQALSVDHWACMVEVNEVAAVSRATGVDPAAAFAAVLAHELGHAGLGIVLGSLSTASQDRDRELSEALAWCFAAELVGLVAGRPLALPRPWHKLTPHGALGRVGPTELDLVRTHCLRSYGVPDDLLKEERLPDDARTELAAFHARFRELLR